MDDEETEQDEKIADVERVARAPEETLSNKRIGVDLLILAAPLDISITDHGGAQDLTGERDTDAEQVHPVVQPFAAARVNWAEPGKERQEHQREDTVVVAEEEVAPGSEGWHSGRVSHCGPTHYLTATIPQKLYQRKNSSTCLNP